MKLNKLLLILLLSLTYAISRAAETESTSDISGSTYDMSDLREMISSKDEDNNEFTIHGRLTSYKDSDVLFILTTSGASEEREYLPDNLEKFPLIVHNKIYKFTLKKTNSNSDDMKVKIINFEEKDSCIIL